MGPIRVKAHLRKPWVSGLCFLLFLSFTPPPLLYCVLYGCQVLRICGMWDCSVLIKFALFPPCPEHWEGYETLGVSLKHCNTHTHTSLQHISNKPSHVCLVHLTRTMETWHTAGIRSGVQYIRSYNKWPVTLGIRSLFNTAWDLTFCPVKK